MGTITHLLNVQSVCPRAYIHHYYIYPQKSYPHAYLIQSSHITHGTSIHTPRLPRRALLDFYLEGRFFLFLVFFICHLYSPRTCHFCLRVRVCNCIARRSKRRFLCCYCCCYFFFVTAVGRHMGEKVGQATQIKLAK